MEAITIYKTVLNEFVEVYNNDELVYDGTLEKFLQDNDNDEWLADQCRELESSSYVEFNHFHSGSWKVVKK